MSRPVPSPRSCCSSAAPTRSTGLQTITIVAALPFVLVMIGLAVALVKDLRHDPLVVRRKYADDAGRRRP